MALLSKVGLDDVVRGLPDAPGFPEVEARAVSATCGGIRVHSLYVPNGRTVGSEHYDYKLAWLEALHRDVAAGPEPAVVCGDMNIAPADADLFDPAAYVGSTHVTEPERAALDRLAELGLRDLVRDHWPDEQVFTLLGLPGGNVPPEPGDAHRPGPRLGTGRRSGARRPGSIGRPARAPGPATTRRSSSTWTRRRTATSARWCRRPRPVGLDLAARSFRRA